MYRSLAVAALFPSALPDKLHVAQTRRTPGYPVGRMPVTPEQFFGKIGVKNGVFTKDQLLECFRIQRRIHSRTGVREPLSYVLMQRGYMDQDQSRDLLQEFKYSCLRKDDKELAALAVQNGYLTRDDLDAALAFQRKLFRGGVGIFQLGEILISRNQLTADQVYELHCLHWQSKNPHREIPEHLQPEAMRAPATDEAPRSRGAEEVELIQRSEAGFRACAVCGYQNPKVATMCYSCGEPLEIDPTNAEPEKTDHEGQADENGTNASTGSDASGDNVGGFPEQDGWRTDASAETAERKPTPRAHDAPAAHDPLRRVGDANDAPGADTSASAADSDTEPRAPSSAEIEPLDLDADALGLEIEDDAPVAPGPAATTDSGGNEAGAASDAPASDARPSPAPSPAPAPGQAAVPAPSPALADATRNAQQPRTTPLARGRAPALAPAPAPGAPAPAPMGTAPPAPTPPATPPGDSPDSTPAPSP